ncbi:hypothetical protein [Candidatus Villigracilis affinis]|uniref:hypothetical protein n=1 Tax=Candidatus Villigracilis affinis TaxID=3140682 RepID=UPI002A1A166F|nr:hypothetical protein [Anaerolineales bacterium]
MCKGITICEGFVFFLVSLLAGEEQTQNQESQRADDDLAIDAPGGDVIGKDEIRRDEGKQEYGIENDPRLAAG